MNNFGKKIIVLLLAVTIFLFVQHYDLEIRKRIYLAFSILVVLIYILRGKGFTLQKFKSLLGRKGE